MSEKSKRKELQESNENAQKAIDESIKSIKDLTDDVPHLHERKMELEANRRLIDSADEVEIVEVYDKLLPMQKQDEQNYTSLSGVIGMAHFEFQNVLQGTTGTSSAYIDFAYTVEGSSPHSHTPVGLIYKDVIDYKAHKVEIPQKLNQLHNDLGTMFSKVHDNVDKAKNGVMTVKQAVSDMRDVLNQLWANLAKKACLKYPDKWRGINNKQFKKKEYHKIVSECLIVDVKIRGRFELILNNIYALYLEMSDTKIGKNPLSEDHSKLDEFYNRWITHIDSVVEMIDWATI